MNAWDSAKDFIAGLAIYCQLEADRAWGRKIDLTHMDDAIEVLENAYKKETLLLPPEDIMCRHLRIAWWIDKAREGIAGSTDELNAFVTQMNNFFRAHPDDDEEEN